MKLIIDIPNYKLDEVQNGSIASNEILKAVRKGTPISTEGDLISREYVERIINAEFVDLQDGTEEWRTYVNDTCENILNKVHNAPTVGPNNEYGAIQYSNGFNDGFTLAKDTIIQNIAKQYSAHNELVPEWLSIGAMRGAKK